MPIQVDQASGNDPKIRRSFILFQYYTGKPIFDCYKNIQQTLGDDYMDYIEFEFWFMRFSRGKFDLNYDNSKHPKPRCITSFPNEILEKILYSDNAPKDRFILRSVCSRFRALTDFQTPCFKDITMKKVYKCIELHFDHTICYYKTECDGNKSLVKYLTTETNVDRNFWNVALDDITSVLMHPNCVLDLLTLNGDDEGRRFIQKLCNFLETKNSQNTIAVRHLTFIGCGSTYLGRILAFFRPGVLENINNMSYDDISSTAEAREKMKKDIISVDHLVNMEQYKRAKMLTFTTNMEAKYFPMKDFMSCSRLTVDFLNVGFNTSQVFRMIKILLKFKNLQLYYLKGPTQFDAERVIESLKKWDAEVVTVSQNTLRYPIPNSNEFFEVELDKKSARIERKS